MRVVEHQPTQIGNGRELGRILQVRVFNERAGCSVAQQLPEFLGDEWNERMQQLKRLA